MYDAHNRKQQLLQITPGSCGVESLLDDETYHLINHKETRQSFWDKMSKEVGQSFWDKKFRE